MLIQIISYLSLFFTKRGRKKIKDFLSLPTKVMDVQTNFLLDSVQFALTYLTKVI